jgi:hypothetical protein
MSQVLKSQKGIFIKTISKNEYLPLKNALVTKKNN